MEGPDGYPEASLECGEAFWYVLLKSYLHRILTQSYTFVGIGPHEALTIRSSVERYSPHSGRLLSVSTTATSSTSKRHLKQRFPLPRQPSQFATDSSTSSKSPGRLIHRNTSPAQTVRVDSFTRHSGRASSMTPSVCPGLRTFRRHPVSS